MNFDVSNNDIQYGDIENKIKNYGKHYLWHYQMIDTNNSKIINAKLTLDFEILQLVMLENGQKFLEVERRHDENNNLKSYRINHLKICTFKSISILEMIFLYDYGFRPNESILYDYHLEKILSWNVKALDNNKIIVLSPKYFILYMENNKLIEINLPIENIKMRHYI
jgi:hypothetical protein